MEPILRWTFVLSEAEDQMVDGFVCCYSDILFTSDVFRDNALEREQLAVTQEVGSLSVKSGG